jgi:sarcosine oxidase, subunit alpha
MARWRRAVLADAHEGGPKAAGRSRKPGPAPRADARAEAPLAPVWMMPQRAGYGLREDVAGPQNDVKVSDVQLAAREGYESSSTPSATPRSAWRPIRAS